MLNTQNNMEFLLSFFALVGACVELDALAEGLGFAEGFAADLWDSRAEYCRERGCEGTWSDPEGEVGPAGAVYQCDDCLLRPARDMFEQARLMAMYDPCYGEEDHGFELDTKDRSGLMECGHCGDLMQSYNDHECYGTRGEAGDARMKSEYEMDYYAGCE